MSIWEIEFLAFYMAFKEYGHNFYAAIKPLIILTNSKSVTGFSNKNDSSTLMDCVHLIVQQVSLTIAHTPGEMNTAADFLSCSEKDPNGKIQSKEREYFPRKPIEVNIESTGIAQEKAVFLIPQTNKRPQTKNFGNVKKHEMPYRTIDQSSQCRAVTQMAYTKTQQF